MLKARELCVEVCVAALTQPVRWRVYVLGASGSVHAYGCKKRMSVCGSQWRRAALPVYTDSVPTCCFHTVRWAAPRGICAVVSHRVTMGF